MPRLCGSYISDSQQTLDIDVLRYRVGYFDSPDKQPYRQLTWDDVSTPASEKLAYTVAAEGFVLLKNDGTLPLQKKLKKMALIGPWGNATEGMQGNYYGTAPFLISPLMGAMAAGYEVTFVEGTSILDTSTDGFASAIAAARAADVVVYAGGIDESVEAEGLDRTTIVWPGVQLDLIKELAGVGKPFIVLQFGAGQVDDSWLLASKSVCTYFKPMSSISHIFFPGQCDPLDGISRSEWRNRDI
jgi:beta-D-xylosidase 4